MPVKIGDGGKTLSVVPAATGATLAFIAAGVVLSIILIVRRR